MMRVRHKHQTVCKFKYNISDRINNAINNMQNSVQYLIGCVFCVSFLTKHVICIHVRMIYTIRHITAIQIFILRKKRSWKFFYLFIFVVCLFVVVCCCCIVVFFFHSNLAQSRAKILF
jgi:hypothetical protein